MKFGKNRFEGRKKSIWGVKCWFRRGIYGVFSDRLSFRLFIVPRDVEQGRICRLQHDLLVRLSVCGTGKAADRLLRGGVS